MKTFVRPLAAPFAIAAACVAFFIVYSYLPLTAPPRYNSPDETSNVFFSRHFARSGTLWIVEPLNLVTDGLVHPRSIRVVDNFLVPGGFLGLPVIYGTIAKAAGGGIIPFLTPLFSVLAVVAWGLLVASRFGRKTGVGAAVLLAAHPAWWYESSRTMLPNVLFCAFLISSAWLFFATPIRSVIERGGREGLPLFRKADAALAGVCIALALAVRKAEAYWIALGIVALAASAWKRVPWTRLAVFAAAAVLSFAPFLILNQAVYGHPFATGYGSGLAVPVGELPHGRGDALLGPLRPLLFPLGFAPRTALANFWTYGVGFFWWWSILVACGVAAFVLTARRRKVKWSGDAKSIAIAGVAVTAWLVLFYGSWSVQDNPDPSAVTIGSSYLRYWLPVFALSTLPVAWLMRTAAETVRPRALRPLLALMLFCYLGASAADVFWAPGEGLAAVRSELRRYDGIVKEIVAKTPQDSLIIVDRADKYVFPDRSVITPLRSETTSRCA